VNEIASDIEIKEIIATYKEEIQGESIFFSDNIPERKLITARRSYAKLENDEEALLLIDTSKYGNAWDGAVLSNVKLYAGNLEGAHTIHLKDIKTITRVEEGDNEWVYINGNRFLCTNAHNRFPTRLVIEMLQKITRCLISSSNKSDAGLSTQSGLNQYTDSNIDLLAAKDLPVTNKSGADLSTQSGLNQYTDSDIDLLAAKDLPVVLAFPNPDDEVNRARDVVFSLMKNERVGPQCLFGEVNVVAGSNSQLADKWKIVVIPSVVVLFRGKLVYYATGEAISFQPTLRGCEILLSILASNAPMHAIEQSLAELQSNASKNAATTLKLSRQRDLREWKIALWYAVVLGVSLGLFGYHLNVLPPIIILLIMGSPFLLPVSELPKIVAMFLSTMILILVAIYLR